MKINTPEKLISEYWNQRNTLARHNKHPKSIFISCNLLYMMQLWDTGGYKEITASTAGLHVGKNQMFGIPFYKVVEPDQFKVVE